MDDRPAGGGDEQPRVGFGHLDRGGGVGRVAAVLDRVDRAAAEDDQRRRSPRRRRARSRARRRGVREKTPTRPEPPPAPRSIATRSPAGIGRAGESPAAIARRIARARSASSIVLPQLLGGERVGRPHPGKGVVVRLLRIIGLLGGLGHRGPGFLIDRFRPRRVASRACDGRDGAAPGRRPASSRAPPPPRATSSPSQAISRSTSRSCSSSCAKAAAKASRRASDSAGSDAGRAGARLVGEAQTEVVTAARSSGTGRRSRWRRSRRARAGRRRGCGRGGARRPRRCRRPRPRRPRARRRAASRRRAAARDGRGSSFRSGRGRCPAPAPARRRLEASTD